LVRENMSLGSRLRGRIPGEMSDVDRRKLLLPMLWKKIFG
jgi:hypothetical protein